MLLVAIQLVFIAACTNRAQENSDEKLIGEINIDGSSTVFPITEAIAKEFKVEQPDVKVTIGVSGTGGGFKKFAHAETQISNASRAIKDSEIQLCKKNRVKYIALEVAYDGIAVMVNKENTWVDHLTVEELKLIWTPQAQGIIKNWNQIRPEWPDKEIHLFAPGIASGTYDYFTEAIVGTSGSSRGDFATIEDHNIFASAIKSDVLALGFSGLAYYEKYKADLKLVPIDNGNGPITPSIETITNSTYQPLSRPLYIYINSKSAENKAVKAFVRFYLDKASSLVKEVGYYTLQEAKYGKQKQKFEDFLNTIE